MDQNGHCFVALSTDQILYTSRKNYFMNSTDTPSELSNPYSSWFPLKDLTEIPNDENMMPFYHLIKASDTILVITSLSIVELSMNYFCNEILLYEYRVLFDDSEASWGKVYSSTIGSNDQILWLGTSKGIYSVDMKSSTPLWEIQLMESLPISSPVTSLLWVADPWAILFAGTETVFYEIAVKEQRTNRDRSAHNGISASIVYHEWIGGNLDSPVVSMHYDSYQDCLWVAERNAVHKRDVNQIWWRYGYKQGAITDNIISIASMYVPSLEKEEKMIGYLWIATKSHGLTRMKIPSVDETSSSNKDSDRWDHWQLFDGPRYLLGPNISFLVSDTQSTQSSPLSSSANTKRQQESSTLLVSTDGGISYLHTEPWTLLKKARTLQTFQYPRHDRNGIVAEVSLEEYGDLSTFYHVPEDSDGIWTAQYAVASALRYSLRYLLDPLPPPCSS
jgi:hypothetical protein